MFYHQQLIDQLINSQDDRERLIGADWLEEQGYWEDASFFRYLVKKQKQPLLFSRSQGYCWFSEVLAGDRDNPTIKYINMVEPSLYNALSQGDFPFKIYPDRYTAINSLRLAYHKWLLVRDNDISR